MALPLVVFVDVDDTLVRSSGTKVIPMSGVIEHVRSLARDGAELYCWSSGGAEYARSIAERLELTQCFRAFLPKPHVLIDDMHITDWQRLVIQHPNGVAGESLASYAAKL